MISVSKNKICLKETKISGYWIHPKKIRDGTKRLHISSYKKCFQQRQHRWAKCIAAQGEYFEGDPSQ
jgi:hypothetical protein